MVHMREGGVGFDTSKLSLITAGSNASDETLLRTVRSHFEP